jgi:hypothetical protein
MAGNSHNCKMSRPCKICGKPDFCNWVDFPSGDELAYCHRITGNIGDAVQGTDGQLYRCKKLTDTGFTVWEPIAQYERNREAWLAEKGIKGHKGTTSTLIVPKPYVAAERKVENVSTLRSPDELDAVYRAFLNLLVLEKKHEEALRSEWDVMPGVYDRIVNTWGLKSIPPVDKDRFSSKERLQNLSRKKICGALVSQFGTLAGVPGFYQRRDGDWTIVQLCGIAYPVFDTQGRIIRIRVGDDYPEVKGNFGGKAGVFYHRGYQWLFATFKDEGQPELGIDFAAQVPVFEYGGEQKIQLNKKGYPAGKVKGKYKNFSSYLEKEVDGKLVNWYTNGCQSGSHISLYIKPGDDICTVYATEGEKKAMVANAILGVPVISIPGVSSFGKLFEPEEGSTKSMMAVLRDRGMGLSVLVYDADKDHNIMVLRNEQQAVQAFQKAGLKIAIGEWNANWGKGLDDILLENIMPDLMMVN